MLEEGKEAQRPALGSATSPDSLAGAGGHSNAWNRAYSRAGTRAVLLNELRLQGGVACLVQLVVTFTLPGIWYSKFYSLDSRLVHLPVLIWVVTGVTGGLGLVGLGALRSLVLGLHAALALSLGAALGAYHTGLYMLMVDRCDRSQSTFLGCATCACAATSSCSRGALRASDCSGCRAWSTDVCGKVKGGILPYMGLVLVVLVAAPAVFSLLVLMRLEKAHSDLASRVMYARALVARELDRLQGGGAPGVEPRVLIHMMATLLRHGGRGDRGPVRRCCEALQLDPGALEVEWQDVEARGGRTLAPPSVASFAVGPSYLASRSRLFPAPPPGQRAWLGAVEPPAVAPAGAATAATAAATAATSAPGQAPPPVTSIAMLRAAYGNTGPPANTTGGGGVHAGGGAMPPSAVWQKLDLGSHMGHVQPAAPPQPPPQPPVAAAPQPPLPQPPATAVVPVAGVQGGSAAAPPPPPSVPAPVANPQRGGPLAFGGWQPSGPPRGSADNQRTASPSPTAASPTASATATATVFAGASLKGQKLAPGEEGAVSPRSRPRSGGEPKPEVALPLPLPPPLPGNVSPEEQREQARAAIEELESGLVRQFKKPRSLMRGRTAKQLL